MGWIRCLTMFSTLMATIVILFTLQYLSSRNPVFLALLLTFSLLFLAALLALLCKLRQKVMDCANTGGGGCQVSKWIRSELGEPFSGDISADELARVLPTHFRYKELAAATGGFSRTVGKGGFGTVYDGVLQSGTRVAVKVLEEGLGGGAGHMSKEKEFRAEVLTISALHHLNLVQLLGYCSEAGHRLLVYEFMENGSLDHWLFHPPTTTVNDNTNISNNANTNDNNNNYTHINTNTVTTNHNINNNTNTNTKYQNSGGHIRDTNNNNSDTTTTTTTTNNNHHHNNKGNNEGGCLSWEVRFRVALETARALAYLHNECRDRILHLDIKPQNILLDSGFHAKISDFGLARRMSREAGQSRVLTNTMSGTPGYLAPEWLLSSGVTDKSDVYSYGMVLLELASGRRNIDHSQDSEHWYFPVVAHRKALCMRLLDIVDPCIRHSVDARQLKLLAHIAFWCVQDDARRRPPMVKVVNMLEGSSDDAVLDPPLAGVFSFSNHAPSDSTTDDEDISSKDTCFCSEALASSSSSMTSSLSPSDETPTMAMLTVSCPTS